MANTVNTTKADVTASVSSLYSDLLNKRRMEREAKEEKKRLEREEKERKKEEKKEEDKEKDHKMTKEERKASELASFESILIGIKGEDLEYSNPKKDKKKYKKWIDDDTNGNVVLTPKQKKPKKTNYRKELEPEVNMLKSLVADQNRFTIDLQKRFQNAAGPATKDAMPLNKTLVDLAAQINASRSNSLGFLRQIAEAKKTIADLYMKQKKLEMELNGGSGSGFNTTDIGLMGSNIASSLFGDNPEPQQTSASPYQSSSPASTVIQSTARVVGGPTSDSDISFSPVQQPAQEFDPSTWEGPTIAPDNSVLYENIPHSVVVEYHKNQGTARFKAVRDDTGEELIGCPVPTSDPARLTFNEKDLIVKGEFDETYKLEIV